MFLKMISDYNSYLLFVYLLLCVMYKVVELSCSEKSSLIPYGSFCNDSSQCVTNYSDLKCACPLTTHYNNFTASCVLNCNATATNSSGQIVSPNYPNLYKNSDLCKWTLSGPPESYYVFSISDMDIESKPNCTYDALTIYDVTNAHNIQLAKFCNSNDTTTKIVASLANSVQIVFMTNSTIQARGFSVIYRSYAYKASILEPRYGSISSPGYPLQYPINSYFSWTISGSQGSFITLSIWNLTIESSCLGSVDIYDGYNTAARLLVQLCSSRSFQRVFMSTGSLLHVVFRSDFSIVYSGLLANYEINECQTVLTDTSGEIVSPGYPLNYVGNLNCSWSIIADPHKIIFLRIKEVQLDCTFDNLKIYDGRDINSPRLGTFSYQSAIATIVSTSNILHLVLETDGNRNDKGFSATYSSVDAPLAVVCNSSLPCVQQPVCLYGRCVCPDNFFYSNNRNMCLEALGESNICDPYIRRMCRVQPQFECRPDKMGVTRCHCALGLYNNVTHCVPYSEMNVVLTSSPHILTRGVTFDWTCSTPSQPVTYAITWVATEDISDGGEIVANPSGVHVQGLTPGTEYNFTVLSILQGNEYYNDKKELTHLSVETMPAPPGRLNESSSNLYNIPYVLKFEPSEGRVALYKITVGEKTYEVYSPELTINDLTLDTRYTYSIIAYNKHGLSSREITGSFKTESVKREEASLNVALIAGVTAMSALVIAVAISLGGMLVVRKRRTNRNTTVSKSVTETDHDEIVWSRPSTAAIYQPKAGITTYMAMNIGDVRAKVNTDQPGGREYDYVMESQTDSCQDETYENLSPTNNDDNLVGNEVEIVYNNVAYVGNHP